MTMTLMDIIKQKHAPEQYAQEQLEAERKHQDHLSFIEGYKAALESDQDIKKALFVSDPTSPSGFKPASK